MQMTDYKIILHYTIIPYYKNKNFFRWLLGCFVSLLEGTEFNHVWLSVHDEKYAAVNCVDLSGDDQTPKNYVDLLNYYSNYDEKIIYVNEVEYNKAINKINELKDVKYSKLKLLLLIINREFETKFLFDEYDAISTEVVARILKAANEDLYPGYSQLCGLRELKTLL